jgi:hypothetical protein
LPDDAVGLALLDDTDDARIALSAGVHALRVVDAGNGVVGARIAVPQTGRKEQHHSDQTERMDETGSAHRSKPPAKRICRRVQLLIVAVMTRRVRPPAA